MTADEIRSYLGELARELARENIQGEICLYGGAVLCLAFQARPSTKDVDEVFEPSRRVRDAAGVVARRHDLPDDWLNDAVKGYVVPHRKVVLYELPGLRVFVPDAEYLLAMKCLAARVDASDRDDVIFLIRHLGLKRVEQVLAIIQQYYPQERVKPATRFFVEEVLSQP